MPIDGLEIVARIAGELERAWNAADGAAFARVFTENADSSTSGGSTFAVGK